LGQAEDPWQLEQEVFAGFEWKTPISTTPSPVRSLSSEAISGAPASSEAGFDVPPGLKVKSKSEPST
jgi:hypothetical protein